MERTAKVIAVVAQKGGTGKTATAAAVGATLRKRGKRVLYVDMDAQANLTTIVTGDTETKNSIADVLSGQAQATDCITPTSQGDIIPASDWLIGLSIPVDSLRRNLEPLRAVYDYIIIDCGPTLGALTANVLTAADWLIVPVHADIHALGMLRQLMDSIEAARVHGNSGLQIAGILITQYRQRTTVTRQMADMLTQAADSLHIHVFKTRIRDGIAVTEAAAMGKSLMDYAPKSNPAEDYCAITKELLNIVETGRKEQDQ